MVYIDLSIDNEIRPMNMFLLVSNNLFIDLHVFLAMRMLFLFYLIHPKQMDRDNHLSHYISNYLEYNDVLFDNDIHCLHTLSADSVEHILHQFHCDNPSLHRKLPI